MEVKTNNLNIDLVCPGDRVLITQTGEYGLIDEINSLLEEKENIYQL